MAYKIGLSVEVVFPQHRDDLITALAELLNEHGATTRTFTVTYEEQTTRGKRTTKETLEFVPGETIELSEFGMLIERPLEAELRKIESVTLSSGSKSVTIGRRSARIDPRTWADDDYQVREADEGESSRRTSQIGER